MHTHTGHDWTGTVLWLVAVAGMAVGYLAASGRARRGPRGWSGWRVAAWSAGCLVVAVAHLLPDPGDARVHMARHLLLGMLAPLGLVLAAPMTLFLRTAPPAARRVAVRLLRSPAVHLLGHPAVTAVLSVGGLYVALLAPLPAHPLLDVHYLAAGYLFVWSVAGPDPAPRRPGFRVRLVVLVLSAAAHAVLAKHLYALAVADSERAAALLMYYGGDVAELLLAIALFTGWYRRRARRGSARADLTGSAGDGGARPAGHGFSRGRNGQPSACE
jgi:putative membrane protein